MSRKRLPATWFRMRRNTTSRKGAAILAALKKYHRAVTWTRFCDLERSESYRFKTAVARSIPTVRDVVRYVGREQLRAVAQWKVRMNCGLSDVVVSCDGFYLTVSYSTVIGDFCRASVDARDFDRAISRHGKDVSILAMISPWEWQRYEKLRRASERDAEDKNQRSSSDDGESGEDVGESDEDNGSAACDDGSEAGSSDGASLGECSGSGPQGSHDSESGESGGSATASEGHRGQDQGATHGAGSPERAGESRPADGGDASRDASDTPRADSVDGARGASERDVDNLCDPRATPGAAPIPGSNKLEDPAEAIERVFGGGKKKSTVEPCERDGGDHLDPRHARILAKSKEARKAAARIRRYLDRILTALEVGIGEDPSPRYDYRRVVRELVSRRCAMSRAKREELHRPLTIVAVDESGSCSSVCAETAAAARAIMRADQDRIVIVEHSNGGIMRVSGGPSSIGVIGWCERESGWEKILSCGRRIAGLVAFGDWDAGDIYAQVARAGIHVIWLDSFSCAQTVPYQVTERSSISTVSDRRGYWRGIEPLAHWAAVGDARGAEIALRMIAKEMR